MLAVIFVVMLSLIVSWKNRISLSKSIPVSLLVGMLFVYVLAIFGWLGWINIIIGICCVGLTAYFFLLLRKGNNKIQGLEALVILFVVAGTLIIIYKNHVVTFSDDFAYYAIFPKTLWYLDRLPDITNTTYTPYNSYSPIMGLFYYWVLRGLGFFSDAVMFICNNLFYYIMCLPFLDILDWKKSKIYAALNVMCYLIFPIAIQSASFHTLGVDFAVGILFGYGVYALLDTTCSSKFYYTRVILSLSVLVLVKTPAIIMALILALLFVIQERKKLGFWKAGGVMALAIGCPYVSWNFWCLFHGMHDYLSVGVVCNVRDAIIFSGFQWPEYTAETALAYLKGLFNISISGSPIGFSTVGWLFVVAVGVVFLTRHKRLAKEEKKIIKGLFLGGFLFCVLHLYMYLFIFAEPEAKALGSFARYILLYLTALIYITVWLFLRQAAGGVQRK